MYVSMFAFLFIYLYIYIYICVCVLYLLIRLFVDEFYFCSPIHLLFLLFGICLFHFMKSISFHEFLYFVYLIISYHSIYDLERAVVVKELPPQSIFHM